jgi:hypothetical protein
MTRSAAGGGREGGTGGERVRGFVFSQWTTTGWDFPFYRTPYLANVIRPQANSTAVWALPRQFMVVHGGSDTSEAGPASDSCSVFPPNEPPVNKV